MKIFSQLSIVVPIKNEEKNLAGCLANILLFQHVIVVDSGSTDSSRHIFDTFCHEHRDACVGWKWIDFVWDGCFPKKRNWVLKNHPFQTPWILFLDADEVVTDRWIHAVEKKLQNDSLKENDAYICFYDNWFMNRLLKHGDVMRKTALLKFGFGEYEKIEEDHWSSLDMEIHEHLVVKGSVGVLPQRMEHHDKRSLESYYKKHEEYAKWESNRYLKLLSSNTDFSRHLTPRQRIKYRLMTSPFMGFAYFIVAYVLKRGFLDGRAGFVFAKGKWRYFSLIRKLIKEKN